MNKPKRRKAARARPPKQLRATKDTFVSASIVDGRVSLISCDPFSYEQIDIIKEDVARLAPYFAQADAYFKARGKR